MKKAMETFGENASKDNTTPDTSLEQQSNDGSSIEDGIKKFNVSEGGIYAYVAMCSITLAELFPNECNKDFNRRYVESMCCRLGINDRAKSVMHVLAEGKNGQARDAYIALLLQESALKGKAIIIVRDMVLLAVREGEYDARHRVLVRRIANLLNVPFELIELYECSLVELLSKDVDVQSEAKQREALRRNKIRKVKRYMAIGLATVAGGTLIGLTGGLAAPFVSVGVGTILGSASAAALSSTVGVAVFGSIFGMAGAGLAGYKMNKRVGEIEEFSFEPLTKYGNVERQLHIAIAIAGWLNNDGPDNVSKPWQFLAVSQEQYALRYETKYLIELGQALEYILSIAVSMATQEALKYTILSSLMSAIAWPAALLSMAAVIDNPWSVCCRRSSEVGKQLANVLVTRQHGKRPVTLIGFSLGARVIFYCLREIEALGGGGGIVQDAIMLGAPVTNSKSQWEKCSRVVAGRLVNGYCRTDWLLRFLYRTLSMTTGVAGLMPVECDRVSNVDLTAVVDGHGEYSKKLPELLQFVGLSTTEIRVLDAEGIFKKSNSDMPYICDRTIDVTLRTSKSDVCLPSTKCLSQNRAEFGNPSN